MDTPLNENEIAAKGREVSNSKWELPAKFRLDPNLIALPPEEFRKRDPEMFNLWERIQAEEKRLAALNAQAFGNISSQDIERARSVTIAEELRGTLAGVEQQLTQAIASGSRRGIRTLINTKNILSHRLAERLAIIGRYDLAASIEPEPAYRNEYLAILDAVWRDDEETCGCPPHRGSGTSSNVSVSTMFAALDVYSMKLGRVVTLMKCNRCGFMNVVDTPAEIQKMRRLRLAAQRLAGDQSIPDAAKTLIARGHTTEKLISK